MKIMKIDRLDAGIEQVRKMNVGDALVIIIEYEEALDCNYNQRLTRVSEEHVKVEYYYE